MHLLVTAPMLDSTFARGVSQSRMYLHTKTGATLPVCTQPECTDSQSDGDPGDRPVTRDVMVDDKEGTKARFDDRNQDRNFHNR